MDEPKKGRMNRLTSYLTGKGFYKVIAICIAVIALAGWFVGSRLIDYNNLVKEGGDLTSVADSEAVNITSNQQDAETGKSDDVLEGVSGETTHAGKEASTAQTGGTKQTANTSGDALFIMPLSGKVQSAFSGDTLVFSETFSDWRVHSGVDIAGSLGAQVKAAGSGKVLSVEDDPLWGTTVTIEHENGIVTIYSNLGSKPVVKKGQEVEVGEVIGSVGQTAQCEIAQDPHLHFAVTKDGEHIDPLSIIAEMSKNP